MRENGENALQALASNDPDRISAVLTEDVEWLSPPDNAVAVALETTHHVVGGAAIARFFSEDFPRLFSRDVAVTDCKPTTSGQPWRRR